MGEFANPIRLVGADRCVAPNPDVSMLETPIPMRYRVVGNRADTQVRPFQRDSQPQTPDYDTLNTTYVAVSIATG